MTELIDETTANVRLRARKAVRRRSAFEVWAWSPVIVLRIALVITYLLYVYFAVISFIAGVPVFALTTPEGYTSVWAVLLGVSAAVACIGSISDHWSRIELAGAIGISVLMLAYVGGLNIVGFASHDINRQAVGGSTAIAFVLPMVRLIYLAAQVGKKPAEAPGKADRE